MIHVIIPVHNAEQYLRRCFDSVASQSFTHWHVWAVVNGCSDTSADICDEYSARDSRISVLNSAKGLSAARNHALEYIFAGESRPGDYIFFLDSDDEIAPHCLQTLHSAATRTGAQIAAAEFAFSPFTKPAVANPECTVMQPDRAVDIMLRQLRFNHSACGKLFSTSVFADGTRFWDGHWYEDLDIFYRLYLNADKVCFVRDKMYFYRQHADSFIHRWTPGRLDAMAVTERAEKFMADNYPELLPAARDRRFAAACNMLGLMHANGLSHTDDADRCWQIIRERRREVLLTGSRRLKNRLGAVLTYLGRTAFATLAARL